MKRFVLILFVFFNCVSFGQVKSDLSFLDRSKLNQITKATKFGYKENYKGINFRVLYVVIGDYKDWFIEYENTNDYTVHFRSAIGDENAYLKKGWSYIDLKPNESNIIALKYNLNNSNNYYINVTLGGILIDKNEKYEFELEMIGEQNILCTYCSLFAKDDFRCPVGAVDMESVQFNNEAYVGDEFTETELGKIKGTIPLSDGEKQNAKIDAAVQGINLLFKLGRDIKKDKEEKRELQNKEQAELLLQQHQETKKRNDEIALRQKLNTPKVEERINLSDVTFKDSYNNQTFSSGQIIFKDGSSYEGNLKHYKKSDGKQNKGKFYFANGDKYEGGFTNQKQEGWGTYIWANGQKFTGTFYNGDILGTGTMTFTNKTYKTGYFKRTTDNVGMNFDDEATKLHQTYRSSNTTQLWQIKTPLLISEL